MRQFVLKERVDCFPKKIIHSFYHSKVVVFVTTILDNGSDKIDRET